jgi:hypothetical protein
MKNKTQPKNVQKQLRRQYFYISKDIDCYLFENGALTFLYILGIVARHS